MTGSIKIAFPVAQPNRNGSVFTEEAARNMIKYLQGSPVVYDGHICGAITAVFEPEVDEYGDVVIPVNCWFPHATPVWDFDHNRIMHFSLDLGGGANGD